MCGLAGIVEFDAKDASRRARQVAGMHAAVAHRGPDGWGAVSLHGDTVVHETRSGIARSARSARAGSAWLGHRRLAIIDLSEAAAQPMRAHDGEGWLVFNGEIYNFRSLDAAARSDAAVLLERLSSRGMAALDELRGMFAFAYWNDREQALYLARDRFGIKPLYWCRPSPGLLAFGSEPRALLAAGFGSSGVRPEADAEFLRRGHVSADQTAIPDLHVLPPGCWLRFDGRALEVVRWFDTASLWSEPSWTSADDAASRFQDALDDSVRAHLVSDVPVGVFLSGGLDSAAIVASCARVGGARLRTFTVVVPNSPTDESAPAAALARAFGTDHTEVPVSSADLTLWLTEALQTMSEPTADGVNTFIVARAAARAGVKVALSGLGGDEVLGGYPSFLRVPVLWRATAPLRHGLPLRRIAGMLGRRLPVAAPGKLSEILAHPVRTRAGLWRQYRSLFERDVVRRLAQRDPLPDDRLADDRPILDVVRRSELDEFMTPQLLRDADMFSMCDGLELRVPFVDHRLMSAVHARGWWPRGRHKTFKSALLSAMPDPLPRAHLRRPKTGFIIPIESWLRTALDGDASLDILRAPLAAEPLRGPARAFQAGRLDANRLWALVVREHYGAARRQVDAS